MITVPLEMSGTEFGQLLLTHPEELMDCLATIAASEYYGPARLVAEGYSGSLHHQRIPGFLRELADRIEERENDT